MCHSDRVLFSLLIDEILSRVLSDRFFFESSVIDSSGSAVIDSVSGSLVLFFLPGCYFLSNRSNTFLIKNRCFVLDYILKKKFIGNN